jgi:hypothetical protein
MTRRDTPYVFDEVDDDADDDPVDPHEVDRETVILDGEAMTYRSYQRRRTG